MKGSEWLSCTNPALMLQYLNNSDAGPLVGSDIIGHRPEPSDRKLRLFACAIMRKAEKGEWGTRRGDSDEMIKRVEIWADTGIPPSNEWVVDASNDSYESSWEQVWHMNGWGLRPEYDISGTIQAALLRDIFGNPFQHVTIPTLQPTCEKCGNSVLLSDKNSSDWWCKKCFYKQKWNPIWCMREGSPWLTPTVLSVAQSIYDNRDYDGMPILADALEDAGCNDINILQHCRGFELCGSCMESWHSTTCSHYRGCWALDLILGKS